VTLAQLRAKRDEIIKRMRDRLKAAETESRDLTEDEDKAWKADRAELEPILASIHRLEETDRLEAEASRSTRSTPPPQERPDPSAGRAPAAVVKPTGTYSILNVLRASSSRNMREAAYEQRISDMLSERFGPAADERAFRIPYRALLPLSRQRELDKQGTLEAELAAPERRDVDSTGAASLIAVDQAAEDFIELLRNEAMVVRAGARMLPGLVGTLDIPRQNAAAAGGWIATETGSPAEGQLTTDKVTLSPKTFGVRTEITRKMLKQATPAAEELVREDIRRVIGLAVDLAAISGSGAAGQPQGIIGSTGVGGVVHGGALTATLANILEYESDLGAANALNGRLAWMMRPAARAALKATPKAAGVASGFLMEMDGTMNGYPSFVTQQAPASASAGAILFGNFAEVLIGMWGVLDLFGDPYTLGNSGGMVVRGFQDIDIGIRHGASFSASSVF